ncbi:hypothetical protein AB0M87_17955 [Streptomyces sp. NPDC051320]|uniref:hypothetical protein n=1 Tax=Streptomyces sp. NPDC051320 TaxID=3154644 RepID=UPI00343B7A18
MNLRTTGLAAMVVLVVMLPAAAAAGPATGLFARPAPSGASAPSGADRAGARERSAVVSGTGASTTASGALPHTAAVCGPEVTSPDGVEAQTCVLTARSEAGPPGATWARTYYRNETGTELDSVLVLLAPGGRTVEMHCVIGTEDEPGTCETPRDAVRGKPAQYTAVAEFARAGDGGDGPLLLRSGSNSPVPTGR